MKIHKIWQVHVDLHIGCSANPVIWTQEDAYSYVIKFSFVRNRRPIADLYALGGTFVLKFILPNNSEIEYELVDIQGDQGTFVVPNEVLIMAGDASLLVEWRFGEEVRNFVNPLPIIIQKNPWEVGE